MPSRRSGRGESASHARRRWPRPQSSEFRALDSQPAASIDEQTILSGGP
jgi:hypothetical protein